MVAGCVLEGRGGVGGVAVEVVDGGLDVFVVGGVIFVPVGV